MRVLIVTTWLSTDASPTTGAFVARDVEALARVADVRVLHLVAPHVDDGRRVARIAGVPVRRLVMDPARPDHVLRAARMVARMGRRADLVHSMAVSAIPPVFLSGRRPWVHTEHWSGFVRDMALGGRAMRRAMAWLARGADRVCAVSDELRSALENLGCPDVAVIANIVDIPGAPFPRPERNDNTLRIVGVGALIDIKRPQLAVRTCAALRARGIDAHLTWVGEGELRQEMAGLARDLGVSLHMVGAVAPQDVAQHLADADVFLGPSRTETFFLAAAEALACGRPAVTGAVGGHAAFVRPPFGLMVAGENPDDFADAVLRVRDAALAAPVAEVGADIRRRYSSQAFADRYLVEYCQVGEREKLYLPISHGA